MDTRRPREREPLEERSDSLAAGGRRPYSPPQLTGWGDVRDLTLGGSAGQLDSLNPDVTEPP